MLVTGHAISAWKALRLGVVDAVVTNMKSSRKSSASLFEYAWLLDVLEFVKQKGIGKNPRTVDERVHEVCPSAAASMEDDEIFSLTEDKLSSTFKPWSEHEKKSSRKYPSTRSVFNIVISFVANLLFCFIALIQIWRKAGLKIPAPFLCLVTTLRCYYAGSWMEATTMNAAGFAAVATSAESKSLMNLFLSTRRLKKVALCLGIESGPKTHDFSNTKLVVLMSNRGLKFSAAVIQGLLYSKLSVSVVDVSGRVLQKNVVEEVRKLFHYSVKRGHMTHRDVNECIARLVFHSKSRVDFDDGEVVVIDSSIGSYGGVADTVIPEALCEVRHIAYTLVHMCISIVWSGYCVHTNCES